MSPADPLAVLEAADSYLDAQRRLREARDDGASPARIAAIAAQLGTCEIGDLLHALLGPGVAAKRSGFMLSTAPGPDGLPLLACAPIALDLDELAELEADRQYEARALRYARAACLGELDEADPDGVWLAGALCFAAPAESELSEAIRAIPLIRARPAPRDWREFADMAADVLAALRRRDDPFDALEAALLCEVPGPIGPDQETLRRLPLRADEWSPESPGPIGPDSSPSQPPPEPDERID